MFDKIASVYLKKLYLYFSIGNWEPVLCQLHRHTFVSYVLKMISGTSGHCSSMQMVVFE